MDHEGSQFGSRPLSICQIDWCKTLRALQQGGIPQDAVREALQGPSEYGLRAQSLAQSISRAHWTCCRRHPAGHQAGTRITVLGKWAAAT